MFNNNCLKKNLILIINHKIVLLFSSLVKVFLFLLFFKFFLPNSCFADTYINNYISLSSISNYSISNLYSNFPFGIVSLGNVDYNIPQNTPNMLITSHADPPGPAYPSIATFSANISSPIELNILTNGGNTYVNFMGKTVGEIIIDFTDNTFMKESLIAGYNFRDWNIQNPAFAISSLNPVSNTHEVLRMQGAHGEPMVVVDMLKIIFPTEYTNKIIRSITLKDVSAETTNNLNPAIMVYGMTVISQSLSIPTPTPFYPVILVPGHGASFNREALLYNKDVPQSDWKMAPFVHSYDGIIKTFTQSLSYSPNKFFVFHYNWRKKVDQLADDLKNFIDSTVAPQNPELTDFKTKIVGHSLGGLVARSYGQKYEIAKIDKLVSVGSPHQGVIQAYKAWEGGEVGERNAWQWLALEMLLQINKRGFATNVQTIRTIAPGTKDLLPIFNYLKLNVSPYPEKPENLMFQQNDWLKGIGTPKSSFFDLFTAIYGERGNTPEFYKIENRSLIDQFLGKWEDGEPVTTDFGNGDYTILSKSSYFIEDPAEQLNLDHGDLIEKEAGIQKILDTLVIPYSAISEAPTTIYNPSLLFLLGSPAKMAIKKPDGTTILSDDDKLIFIEDAQAGDYEIKVIGEDPGDYRLIIGQLTENGDYWNEYEGQTKTGQEDFYKINFTPASPLENPLIDEKGQNYLKQAKEKLLQTKEKCDGRLITKAIADINLTITNLNQKRFNLALVFLQKALLEIFGARRNLSNTFCRNLTYEPVQDLSLAYPLIFQKSGQKIDKKILQKAVAITEKLLETTRQKLNKAIKNGKAHKNQVISFNLAEENLKRAKEAFAKKDYPYCKILLEIVNLPLSEVI